MLPHENIQELSISLKNGSNTVKTESASLFTDRKTETVVLDGLAAGTYTLLVEADGFADFEQEIEVDRNIRTAEIYAGFLDLEYEADSVHPGALLIGDADGNGKLDEKDKEFLIDSMSAHQDPGAEAEDAGKENGTADLNRDQAVDLSLIHISEPTRPY